MVANFQTELPPGAKARVNERTCSLFTVFCKQTTTETVQTFAGTWVYHPRPKNPFHRNPDNDKTNQLLRILCNLWLCHLPSPWWRKGRFCFGSLDDPRITIIFWPCCCSICVFVYIYVYV